jgi:DNA-binding response OmpR family regulator
VRKGKQLVPMAAKELQLLRYLVRHRDRVNPREEMRGVWVRFEPPCDSSRMVGITIPLARQLTGIVNCLRPRFLAGW